MGMADKTTFDGWHFLPKDCRLQYSDGRRVQKGKTNRVKGTPVLCVHGLHASARAVDALQYCKGPMVARVRLSGDIVVGNDKAVATARTELTKRVDATKVLHEFACWCAERVLRRERKAGREPDDRSWNAIKTKRAWLDGKATDDELNAAWVAAWAAAAAADAARAAAAAEDRDAAKVAARNAQNAKLESLLTKLLENPAA